MEEIWRDIKNYEGLYQISNYGRVKSLERIDNYNRSRKEKILKPKIDRYGYACVSLFKEEKEKTFKVHRLVAQAFLPNPHNYTEVNHKIEEDKTNNFVYVNEDGTVDLEKSNIEWCTASYNVNYGTRNERVAVKLTNGKCSKPVLQIDKATNEIIAEFPSIREIQRKLGFSHAHISKCCLKKPRYNTAYGYKWQFK